MSYIVSLMLCLPEITVRTSFLFLKHLFPLLTFNSPRRDSASHFFSSAQHTGVSKHGFSVSGMTMIQNLKIEVYFCNVELKINLYCEDETFFLAEYGFNNSRSLRLFTNTVIYSPCFDLDTKFFIPFKIQLRGEKKNPRENSHMPMSFLS